MQHVFLIERIAFHQIHELRYSLVATQDLSANLIINWLKMNAVIKVKRVYCLR